MDAPRTGRRWPAVLLVCVGLGLALVSAGWAKARWIDGLMVRSTVISCASIATGNPLEIVGAVAQVGFYADPQKLRVGQTFYARIFVGGAGVPCADQAAGLELVLPVGVKLAISAKTPVRCTNITQQRSSRLTPAQGCPRRASRGPYGWLFARSNRRDGMWALPAGEGVFVDVPLRSTRRLNGIASGTPNCVRSEFQPPCPPSRARDHLQVGVRVSDGNGNPWLVPSVGLHVN